MNERSVTGVAMLGQGFMGDAHTRALLAVGRITDFGGPKPHLLALAGRNEVALADNRSRYGWETTTTNWRRLFDDPRVEVFDNVGPNALHVEPTLVAIGRGLAVICEKPLAPTAEEARQLWRAAEDAGVPNAVAFNYRFFPAIVALREMVSDGELGQIVSVTAEFIVPKAGDEEVWRRRDRVSAGGVAGDMMAHHLDLLRFIVGEPLSVSAHSWPERELGLEDHVDAVFTLPGGATAQLRASRALSHPTVTSTFRVLGSEASAAFSLERLNELTISDENSRRQITILDPEAPFLRHWYPAGHSLGWDASFVHQLDAFLRKVHGLADELTANLASFEDGYRCALLVDAVRGSASTHQVFQL